MRRIKTYAEGHTGETYKFPLVIEPEVSKLDKALGWLIILLVMGPIVISIVTQEMIYLWGILIGFLAIWISNLANGGKFLTRNKISKNKFIIFTATELRVEWEGRLETIAWESMRNIVLFIEAYPGRGKYNSDDSYRGTENKVTFLLEDSPHQYFFYIKERNSFADLVVFIKGKVLPQLYALKNIKDESLVISKLTYEELQHFKEENRINRYTDQIYFD